ncbi:hypothetical protein F2P56_028660 [Juglans regia]|uniref:Glycosyltransferase BC10-like n=2 Tax=Juglans regia TaxID=51240 RepID=A0A833UC04_JUGRE|nr:glycosyltransferase BC10 [Juglans regia]KAF5448095.1 hypothetical protein F2P56_028660 [Juglans regia]
MARSSSRRSGDHKEETDKHTGLLKLVQILSFLLVFVAGVVIGLAATWHINRKMAFNYHPEVYSFVNHVSAPGNCTSRRTVVKPVDCLSMEAFLRPINVTHGMSDEELFWRASMVPKKKEYPNQGRVPKVAFMFLTRGPLPMLPLWERFFWGHARELYSVYVHAPPGYNLNVSTHSPFYGRQIPSQKVEWGTATLSDAERRLLGNGLLDFSNERFVLLSESCIPVYNFPVVYKYLTASSHSFVESYDDPSRYGRGRYNRNMLPYIQLRHWRKGSQWFELQRALAISIVADTNYYTLFSKYCRPACYPDEHYIPTFLHMFYASHNSNRTVTWVDWSMGGPHPALYGKSNITDDFIRSIRNNGTHCQYNSDTTSVCYLFARKFAPSALQPLLNLSSTVLEF